MANRQIKIDLLFQANTAAAQNNIQQLSHLLNQISTQTVIGVDGSGLSQAVSAAQQLQSHLSNAVNVDTGKIDLTKLRSELKMAGTDLGTMATQIRSIGPAGEQAFLKIASAVSQASVPMVQANGLIKNFMTTLANTAKWQVASSAIHGIVGAFNSATSHAKNLNKALTDIQIVTGYSTDYMSKFAETASKAAKALNTTTVEYAKAALIFYQQGLSGDAVAERTETVIKLAQVTGQTAQTVSDQMTAIWNNFSDGADNLERYADVLTKLGAATAASTDEISDGLQKFAAVAKTVGLSYETAAASVATVIDKTRQSADVVGTSFKTIFARIEGLSLGDTLEDGVDLNKYSEALDKVGVNVLTAKGELRSMDNILDDLGSKWQGLGEETQIALAQTVGGVRQYNQMMALMNNWEDVKDNIELAGDAAGELAVQQAIWSKSYEGSLERLNQAKDELYESFIDEDTLISLTDALTVLTESTTTFIENLGGLGPLVMMITMMFNKTLFPLIGAGFKRLGNTISVWTGKAARDVHDMQSTISIQMNQMVQDQTLSSGMRDQIILSDKLLRAKQMLALTSKNMSASQRMEAESRMAVAESMVTETSELLKQQSILEKQIQTKKSDIMSSTATKRTLATGAVLDKFRSETQQEDSFDVDTEEAIINNVKTKSRAQISTELKQANSEVQYLNNFNQEAQQRQQNAKTEQQLAQNDIDKYSAELERLKSAQQPQPGGDYRIYSGKKGGAIQHYSPEEYQRQVQEAEANLNQAETRKANAISEQEVATEEIAASNEVLEKEEKRVALLTKSLELTREIAQTTRDNAALESTAVEVDGEKAITKGVTAGSEESQRLHKADIDTVNDKTQYGAEQQQTAAIAQSMGGTTDGGAMQIEASVANYEKLYKAMGDTATVSVRLKSASQDVNNILNKSSGATQETAKAQQKLTKAQQEADFIAKKYGKNTIAWVNANKKVTKAQKELDKAFSNASKNVKKAKDEYKKLAQQAGLTGDELKEFEQAFENLDGSASDQANLEKIKNTLDILGIASDNVAADLQPVADEMRELLLAANLPQDEIDELTRSLAEAARQAPETARAMDVANKSLDDTNIKSGGVAQKIGQFTSSAMSLGGAVMGLTSAFQGLNVLWDENATGMEKFQAIMGLMMGVLPVITLMVDAWKAAQDRKNKQAAATVAATSAEIAAETTKAASTWGVVAANIASLLSSPWTWALAAVAIAAIIAMVVVINQQKESTEKLTEAQREQNAQSMENSQQTAELADAWLEQMGVMDQLITKYKELKEAQQGTTEATKDILEAMPDLLKAYDELAENVLEAGSTDEAKFEQLRQQLENAAAMGDIDAVESLTYQIDKLLSKNSVAATKTGVSAGTANIIDDFYNAGLKDVHKVDSSSANVSKSNIFVEDLETDSAIWGDLSRAGLTTTRDSDGYAGLALRTDTNEAFIKDYEAMLEVYEKAIRNPDNANDEGVQVVKKILDATESSYNELKELYDSEKTQQAAAASLQLGDLGKVNGYKGYAEHRSALINELAAEMGWEDAEKYADQFLSENEATQDFNKMRKKMDALAEKNSDFTANYLAGLTSEEQKLFLEVDINKYQTKTAIESALDVAQSEADAREITATMNIVSSMKDSLSDDGMTATDWENIRDSGFKWGEEGNIEFAEFMSMSYKEQSEYLDKINLQQQKNLILTKEKARVEVEAGLQALQQEILSGELSEEAKQQKISEYDALVAQHKEITDELLIQSDVLKNMEISAVGLDVGEVKEYAAHLQEVSKNSDNVSIHLQENNELATMVAKSTMRMNRGVEALNESIMEWDDVLKNSDKSSQEYSQALSGLRTAMGDLLDVDEEFLSSEFLSNPENLELMKQAAEGSASAIDKLAKAASKDILLNVEMPEDTKNQVMRLHDTLVQNLPNLKVGATVDESGFQELIDSAKMSVEEAQAYFNALGYEPTFEMHEETSTVDKPLMTYQRDNLTYDEKGNLVSWNETVRQTGTAQVEETTLVPTLSADGSGTPKIKGLTKTSSGSMNNFSAKNAGGSKAKVEKAKEIDKTDKSDIVERYKEVTDALDDVENAMNKASKAADRLYGPARLKEMEKSNKLIKDKIGLLEQQKEEALDNLEIDKKALGDAATKAGVKLELDENGNITNYTSEMTRLYEELARREAIADSYAGGSEEKQSEYIENNIEPLKQIIENLKTSMGKYEETRELLEDLDTQLDEEFYAWQDNNYDQLNYKLELQVEINDSDLEEIDYYLGKMENDFYKMAESAALLIDSSSALGKSKLGVYADNYTTDSEHFNSLQEAFNKGEISQAAFVEGMKEVSSNALADAQALQELDDTMLEYYGNTLAMAGEELAKYTERMEHQTAILEHYKSIMDIIGESTDYEAMGIILEGQAKTIENELTVAKKNYVMLAGEADHWKKMMESVDETDPAFEVYKANWEDAEAAAREAQDTMLSKTEEWAEAMKAVLENKLAGLAQTLENALTGGTSFDTITTQMERAASLQEEYLTTTNKIYHTNKMINTAQQAIDKTTNTVAKQKLKSFQQETAQLQAKKKLSQYELDIQQAKYDLLLAEIALEEAQQSKSMVRLQKDSEGNFGYIYTADQNQLADAQQKVLDAQNALYNKGLDGANDYTQKYQQTMQEMYDALGEIQEKYLSGEFESEEEYHKAMEEAKAYYYQKLQDYSSLYQVAITTDSRVVADAWSTDFADMTYQTEDWKDAVDEYVADTNLAFESWEETVRRIKEETVGENLDALAEKTGTVTSASDKLTESVVKEGGLLDALGKEIEEVGKVTTQYATQRDMVISLIGYYETLATKAKEAWLAQSLPPATDDNGSENDGNDSAGTEGDVETVGAENGGADLTALGLEDGDEIPEPTAPPQSDGVELPEAEIKTTTPSVTVTTYSSAVNAQNKTGRKIPISLTPDTISYFEYDSTNRVGSFSYGGQSWIINEEDKNRIEKALSVKARTIDNRGYYVGTRLKILSAKTSNGKRYLENYENVVKEDNGNYWTSTIVSSVGLSNNAKFTVEKYFPKDGGREAYYIGKIDGHDGLTKLLAKSVSLDTGGYTGSWGTEGKIAMLHEKELVLNADDTTNFLASLEVLREIVNTINLHSMNAQLGGLLSSPYWTDSNHPQTLEQQVHIEANFPNVSDRNEIEEAFNNLVSKASQYVNRK